MGKINYGRVILGGIVSGIVATLLDWFSNAVLLGHLWDDAMKSLNRPTAFSGTFLGGFIVLELVGGILAVWTYAAIRPRFGAGMRTATYAGLLIWALAGVLPTTMNVLTTTMGRRLGLYTTLLGLVSSVVATVAGAALDKEAESTAAYPAAAPQATR
jgi:hypothetical protein